MCGRLIVSFCIQTLQTMPQITLSVPNEKLPILNNVLQALGIEERKTGHSKEHLQNAFHGIGDSANSLFKKYFGWEYFSNELEFE